MKKRHYLFSVLAFILVMMFVVSCAPVRRPGTNVPSPTPGTRQTRGVPRTTPNQPLVPSPTPGPVTPNTVTTPNPTGNNRTGTNVGDMENRAERIADAAAEQKEIESAACVITGNTAMVGVQFNEQYKGKLTDAIKSQVENKVKDADNRITRVVVTADPDLVSRIEDIFKDIGNGKPISGFTKELNEMINRINPQ